MRAIFICLVALVMACATTQEPHRPAAQNGKLSGKSIAILATDGVEQIELTAPREAFEAAGAQTVLIAPRAGKIQAFKHQDKADQFNVDLTLSAAHATDYDALFLPGGALNPDSLRNIPEAVAFVHAFAEQGKSIAAICHGPWTLVEADLVRGRNVTSWPSLKTDLINAGATWLDQPVVVDGNLITSRKPEDIPMFVSSAINQIAQQPSQQMRASMRSEAPSRIQRILFIPVSSEQSADLPIAQPIPGWGLGTGGGAFGAGGGAGTGGAPGSGGGLGTGGAGGSGGGYPGLNGFGQGGGAQPL